MAVEALRGAVVDARLSDADCSLRVGLTLGSALGTVEDAESALALSSDLSPAERGLTEVWRIDADLRDGLVGTERGVLNALALQDPTLFSVTCVSGLCALEQAAADIAFKRVDVAVIGAFDTLSRSMVGGFTALSALSTSGETTPGSAQLDGIVIGEAASFFVLEPVADALARGVAPQACILSQRLVSDAYHLTTPDTSGEGMARAIRQAVADAGLAAVDVGAVLVTALGSPLYDKMLTAAIQEGLGSAAATVPVSSWEPAIGHVLAATGTVGVAYGAEVIRCGEVPAMYPPPSSHRLQFVVGEPRALRSPVVLVLVVGFGGQNGAILLGDSELASRAAAGGGVE